MKFLKYAIYLSYLLILWAIGTYIVQHPYFQIANISIVNQQGSWTNANQTQVFQAVLPHLTGSFFNINVQAAQKAALQVPWVAHAKVNRVSPSTIEVQIEEYQVAARWLNQGYRAGLVTPTGQIFQAETEQKIVELDSPPAELPNMLHQYMLINAQLKPWRLEVERLKYDERGAWTLRLNNGVEVRLGKDQVHSRINRFTQYWVRDLNTLAPYLDYVDMRYPDAFSIRLNEDAPKEMNPVAAMTSGDPAKTIN